MVLWVYFSFALWVSKAKVGSRGKRSLNPSSAAPTAITSRGVWCEISFPARAVPGAEAAARIPGPKATGNESGSTQGMLRKGESSAWDTRVVMEHDDGTPGDEPPERHSVGTTKLLPL